MYKERTERKGKRDIVRERDDARESVCVRERKRESEWQRNVISNSIIK